MRRATEAQLRVVDPPLDDDLDDGLVEGATYPLVPAGEYLAYYVDHVCVELRQFRRSPRLFVRFRLTLAGEFTGIVLWRAYRVRRVLGRRRFIVGPRSLLTCMIWDVLGKPRRLDRISLRDLKGLLLRVRVRVVTQDSRQHPLPEGRRYSVIDQVLGKETVNR